MNYEVQRKGQRELQRKLQRKLQRIVASVFLFFLIPTSAYSGEKIDLGIEIEKVNLKLKYDNLTQLEQNIALQYSEVLGFIQGGTPGVGLHKYHGQLGRKKIRRVKEAIFSLPFWVNGAISSREIYRFLNYIEEHKERLRKSASASDSASEVYSFPGLSNGRARTVTIFSALSPMNPKASLFLDFNRQFEQAGSKKYFKRAIQYKDFNPVAELVCKNDPQAKACFKREIDILAELSYLPTTERSGLGDLLAYMPGRLFQSLADMDLLDFLDRAMGTPAQKLDIVSQLATGGLLPLHNLGIAHNDIKFANILIREANAGSGGIPTEQEDSTTPHRFNAVYSDFDLATQPQIDLDQNLKPRFMGSDYTLAPEIYQNGSREWIGENDQQKVENYLKADVFSQGIITLLLLKPEESREVFDCWQTNTNLKKMLICRGEALIRLKRFFLEKRNYDALDHLLLQALQDDPRERISAKQFSTGITHIVEKTANLSGLSLSGLSLSGLSLSGLSLSGLSLSGPKLESLNLFLKDFPNYRTHPNSLRPECSNGGSREVLEKEVGSYFLTPERVGTQQRIALVYVDQNRRSRKQILDIDPLVAGALAKEIEYLQEIGTLKRLPQSA